MLLECQPVVVLGRMWVQPVVNSRLRLVVCYEELTTIQPFMSFWKYRNVPKSSVIQVGFRGESEFVVATFSNLSVGGPNL